MTNTLKEVFEMVAYSVFFLIALVFLFRFTKYAFDEGLLFSLNVKTDVERNFDDGEFIKSARVNKDLDANMRLGEDVIAEAMALYEDIPIEISGSLVNKNLVKLYGVSALKVQSKAIYEREEVFDDTSDKNDTVKVKGLIYTKIR